MMSRYIWVEEFDVFEDHFILLPEIILRNVLDALRKAITEDSPCRFGIDPLD
jgi:hypothetical protein